MLGLFSQYLAAGGTLSESEKKRHLIKGCSEVINVECRTLKTISDSITLRKVTNRLKSAAMDANLDDLKPSSKEVNAANFKSKPVCFCCFNPQHVVRNCPFARGNGPFCLFCFVTGHWTNSCPYKKCRLPSASLKSETFHFDTDDEGNEDEGCNIDSRILSGRIQF